VWDRHGDLLLLFGGEPGDVPVVGDWNGDGRDKIGIFRQGFLWLLDVNGDGEFTEGKDPAFPFGGVPGDQPVVGHWNGKKISQVGIYRQGEWLLDQDGDRKLTPADPIYHFGGLPNDVAAPGDWIGDGRSRLGIYRQGLWILDENGNGKFDAGSDRIFSFGGLAGDRPIAAKW
jgi:serine-aspartate repeat-containing protein C/D/E